MARLLLPTRRRFLGTALGGAALAGVSPRLMRAQGAPVKVAGIYTVPVEQQWVSRIHIAAQAAEARGEVSYAFSENTANTDYPRVMREYAEKGVQLIVGEAFGVEQEAREVAADYPGTAFLMGSSYKADPKLANFAVFDNYIQDASFLTGIIAGAMTKSGKIGMVGGFPIPEVNRLMNAFMAGAKEANSDVSFSVSFIGSWFDPPKAKETAFAMIEAGADMLYAERFGVSDAAKEKGVLAIGNVIDTQKDYPDTVVASALWHFEPTMDAAVTAVKTGKFAAADYGVYSTMVEGGCSLAPLGSFTDKVPPKALTLVHEKQGAILDGSLKIKVDDSAPTA